MTDFELVVESYLAAARTLGLSRADVERAVIGALRVEHRCASCRFGRAPHGVVKIATLFGRLDIFNRRCAARLPQKRCAYWERLKRPSVVRSAPPEEALR